MASKSDGAWAGVGLFVIALWLAAAVGWIMNIYKIVMTMGDPLTGLFIFRCIGVLAAPIGAVLGYL
jgi:hypothetical protein